MMSKAQGKAAATSATREAKRATESAGGGAAEVLGSGNLDQVREILFGAQSRSLEKRLARMEEELPRRFAELRDELRRGLTALETYARQEIDSLNVRLKSEGQERVAGEEAFAVKAEETSRTLRKDLAQLDERSESGQRELRQHILEQSKRLDEEIGRRVEELAATLGRSIDELRAEKVDRTAMAGALHEVAIRLTDDLTIPLDADQER
jgi:hypothetical protein